MTTHKGVYYFPTYKSAEIYAQQHGAPTNRIISYGRGWAIQLRISGPYVGPTPLTDSALAKEIAVGLHQ